MSLKQQLSVEVMGHCKIVDDLGNVLLDETNAVHPQNLACVFGRALANEHNYFIHRIAFGNGGTVVDAARTVTYRTPNDGQSPDISTWDSRIYRETYSEIIDEGQTVLNTLLGTDPGSADMNTGVRLGGGAMPGSDPRSVPHVSGPGVRSRELGLQTEVIITCTINGDEPRSQHNTDALAPSQNTETDFIFDEIGLYTSGSPAIDTSGYQYINVLNKTTVDDTGLLPGTTYSFNVSVDGGTTITISFTTPITGGSGVGRQILYGDLCEAINTSAATWGFTGSGTTALPAGAKMLITDNTGGTFPTIAGAQTFGYLAVQSATAGATSKINLTGNETSVFLGLLNPPLGASLEQPVDGNMAGVQNAPTNPSTERERLLTHLIFSPILKSKNRTLAITYTLTVSVGRTPY